MSYIMQEEVQKRLTDYLKKHPTSILQLSKEIGIDRRSLDNLLKGKNIQIKTLSMISKFLDSKDKN